MAYSVSLAGVQRTTLAGTDNATLSCRTSAVKSSVINNTFQEMIQVSVIKGYGFVARKKSRFVKRDIPYVYYVV